MTRRRKKAAKIRAMETLDHLEGETVTKEFETTLMNASLAHIGAIETIPAKPKGAKKKRAKKGLLGALKGALK